MPHSVQKGGLVDWATVVVSLRASFPIPWGFDRKFARYNFTPVLFRDIPITALLYYKLQLFGALTWVWSAGGVVSLSMDYPCNLGFPFYPSTGAILLFRRLISIPDRSGLQDWASGVELVVDGGLPILNKVQACLLTFCNFLFHTALI